MKVYILVSYSDDKKDILFTTLDENVKLKITDFINNNTIVKKMYRLSENELNWEEYDLIEEKDLEKIK